MISSDKNVDPVSVMRMTRRLTQMVVHAQVICGGVGSVGAARQRLRTTTRYGTTCMGFLVYSTDRRLLEWRQLYCAGMLRLFWLVA